MQSQDALHPFLWLIASTVERSQLENKSNLREIHVWIKAALRRKIESRLHPPKEAPPEPKNWKAPKRPVNVGKNGG